MNYSVFIDEFDKLSEKEQFSILDMLQKRAREKRREKMVKNCERAVKDFKAGKTFRGVDNLFKAIKGDI